MAAYPHTPDWNGLQAVLSSALSPFQAARGVASWMRSQQEALLGKILGGSPMALLFDIESLGAPLAGSSQGIAFLLPPALKPGSLESKDAFREVEGAVQALETAENQSPLRWAPYHLSLKTGFHRRNHLAVLYWDGLDFFLQKFTAFEDRLRQGSMVVCGSITPWTAQAGHILNETLAFPPNWKEAAEGLQQRRRYCLEILQNGSLPPDQRLRAMLHGAHTRMLEALLYGPRLWWGKYRSLPLEGLEDSRVMAWYPKGEAERLRNFFGLAALQFQAPFLAGAEGQCDLARFLPSDLASFLQEFTEYFENLPPLPLASGEGDGALISLSPHPATPLQERLGRWQNMVLTSADQHQWLRFRSMLEARLAALPQMESVCNFLDRLFTGLGESLENMGGLLEQPALLDLLLTLFAQTPHLSHQLLASLQSFDEVVLQDWKAPMTPETWRSKLGSEGGAEALSRLKTQEELRIGLRFFAGKVPALEVLQVLGRLADFCIERCYEAAQSRCGKGGCEALVVLVSGKLGGGEMGFTSDLDLIYVTVGEGRGETPDPSVQALARELTGFLAGGRPLYPVDFRLRPDGGQGVLVSTVESFRRYLTSRAAPWEWMLLLKTRQICGSPDVAGMLRQELGRLIGQSGALEHFTKETWRLKGKIEREKELFPGGPFSLKYGHGGLFEVESLLALGQFEGFGRNGFSPETRPSEVVEWLNEKKGLEEDDVRVYREALEMLRHLELLAKLRYGREVIQPNEAQLLLETRPPESLSPQVVRRWTVSDFEEIIREVRTRFVSAFQPKEG